MTESARNHATMYVCIQHTAKVQIKIHDHLENVGMEGLSRTFKQLRTGIEYKCREKTKVNDYKLSNLNCIYYQVISIMLFKRLQAT